MKKFLRSFRLPGFAPCVLLLVVGSSAARATSFSWKNNSVGGLYSDPNNWVSLPYGSGVSGPPKAGDDAAFPPSQTIQFKAGDASATAIIGVSSVFDLTSGGYNVSGAVTIDIDAVLTLSVASGAGNILSAGSIAASGGDLEIDANATLSAGSIVGHDVYVEGGTAKVSGLTTAYIEVDGGSFSTGSVKATGIKLTSPTSQPSQFSVAGDLNTAYLTITGQGSVAHAATSLASGNISLAGSGATLSIDGALNFGFAGNGVTSGMSVKSGGFVSSGTAEASGNHGYITVDGIGSQWLVNGLFQADATSADGTSATVNNGGSLSVGSMDLGVAAGSNGNLLMEDDGLLGTSLSVTQGPLRIGVGGSAYLSAINSKVTISGGAAIQLGVNPGSSGSLYLNGGGGTFGIGATQLNTDNAPIQVGVSGQGQMSVSGGAEITTGPVSVAVQPTSGTADNPCSLVVDGGASMLTIHGPLVIAKNGATAFVSTYNGGTLIAQSLQLGVNGSLNVTGGSALVGSGTPPAAGTLLVAGGGILSGQGRAQGATVMNTSVTGNVVIGAGGTFVPGGDPNVFSIQGDCDLSDGETDIEVASAGTAGTDYDQLIVSGKVTLGGTLKLVLLNGYTPKVGDTLDIISAGTISGNFAQIIAPGLTLSPVPGTGKLSVKVTSISTAAAPVLTSAATALGSVGSPFSYQITATNSPAGYAATGLPDGLTLNAASGVISGTPTATGTFNVGISATNVGGTGAGTLVLTVVAAQPGVPTITSAASVAGTLGQPFSYQITASNAPTSFAAAGLPDGLSINAAGSISGAPTQVGQFSIMLSAANGAGTGTTVLTLTVADALPVVSLVATTPTVTVGSGNAGKFTVSLSAAQDHNVTVAFTIKGTAINGTDYTLISGTRKIKAGKTSKFIKIIPQGDLGGASRETVKIKLEPGTGYTVGTTGKVKVAILAGQ